MPLPSPKRTHSLFQLDRCLIPFTQTYTLSLLVWHIFGPFTQLYTCFFLVWQQQVLLAWPILWLVPLAWYMVYWSFDVQHENLHPILWLYTMLTNNHPIYLQQETCWNITFLLICACMRFSQRARDSHKVRIQEILCWRRHGAILVSICLIKQCICYNLLQNHEICSSGMHKIKKSFRLVIGLEAEVVMFKPKIKVQKLPFTKIAFQISHWLHIWDWQNYLSILLDHVSCLTYHIGWMLLSRALHLASYRPYIVIRFKIYLKYFHEFGSNLLVHVVSFLSYWPTYIMIIYTMVLTYI